MFFLRESPPSSQHYSIHSSLLTDLSLTPSPPADQPLCSPKPEKQSRDVDTSDNDDHDDDDDDHDADDDDSADRSNSTNGDSVNQSKSRSSSSSSGSSSCNSQSSPLRTVVDSLLTTPPDTRCSEELTDDLSQSPPTSPHFNTPDALDPAISVASFQHKDILGLQGPSSSSLSLSLDTLPCSSSTPKPCSINNNLLCSPLPSPYCSPSPAYSMPSPGSAFSLVISRRRESET